MAAEPVFALKSFRASPQAKEIAILVVLGTASAAILDYLLKSRAAADYDKGHLLQFFAIFYTVVQVVTFMFQAFAAVPLQRRLGVGRSVTMLPVGLGVGAIAALFFPLTPVFALARGTELVVRGSLFRSGYELLFSAMTPREKRRVKTFLDVACDRAGDALGASIVQLLLLTGPLFVVNEMLGVVLLMAAASIWIGKRLDSMYLRSIEQRLVDQAAADGLMSMGDFGGPTLLSIEVPVVEHAGRARGRAARASRARAGAGAARRTPRPAAAACGPATATSSPRRSNQRRDSRRSTWPRRCSCWRGTT